MTRDADFSEVLRLEQDLRHVPADVSRNVKKALEVTSRHIKDDWRQGADRTGLHGYAASVDYDVTARPGVIESEIGPNLGKNQGSLGLVEEATGDVKSAPQHAGRDALKANESDFERGLLIAVVDTLKAVDGV